MQLYITDKTGKKFWNTSVFAEYSRGERNNLARNLAMIKAGNKAYSFVDRDSARLVEEVDQWDQEINTDDLLAELLD